MGKRTESTVFTGTNHAWVIGAPLLFETVVKAAPAAGDGGEEAYNGKRTSFAATTGVRLKTLELVTPRLWRA